MRVRFPPFEPCDSGGLDVGCRTSGVLGVQSRWQASGLAARRASIGQRAQAGSWQDWRLAVFAQEFCSRGSAEC